MLYIAAVSMYVTTCYLKRSWMFVTTTKIIGCTVHMYTLSNVYTVIVKAKTYKPTLMADVVDVVGR